MQKKIIFTSDLHGNLTQYKKLLEYSKRSEPYALVLGGDLAPKGGGEDYIIRQRRFLETFRDLFKPIKDTKIYLMMGNDDCKCNLDILEKLEKEGHFSILNEKRLSLDDNFDIVGYSYVPITPFGIKDWEKFDLTSIPKDFEWEYLNRLKTDCRFNGFKTRDGRWEDFRFNKGLEKKDSIELDLRKEIFTKNPKKTLYIFHSPPFKTNLDMTYSNPHVGSMATRLFIEKHQPYLTLHGHIHETVNVSRDFKNKIGNTLCLSSGNHNIGELFLLEFDLYDPMNVRRVSL